MAAWESYSPADFLLFSPRAYWRLFEQVNAEAWPWQIAILLLGAAALLFALRPRPWSDRVVAGLLALAWIWTGLRFVGHYYAEINWLAADAMPLFLVQGALLAGLCALPPLGRQPAGHSALDLAGPVLLVYALLLHPLAAPVAGRPLAAAELVGLAPDPGAIATLGFLLLLRRRAVTWLLAALPLLWCLASAATLLTMGTAQGAVPLASALLFLVARLWPARADRG